MLLRVCGLLEYSCQLSVPINYLSFLNVNKGAGSVWQLTIKLICWINFLKCKKRHPHRGNNHTELLPKINRALNTLVKSTPARTQQSGVSRDGVGSVSEGLGAASACTSAGASAALMMLMLCTLRQIQSWTLTLTLADSSSQSQTCLWEFFFHSWED